MNYSSMSFHFSWSEWENMTGCSISLLRFIHFFPARTHIFLSKIFFLLSTAAWSATNYFWANGLVTTSGLLPSSTISIMVFPSAVMFSFSVRCLENCGISNWDAISACWKTDCVGANGMQLKVPFALLLYSQELASSSPAYLLPFRHHQIRTWTS